MPYPYHHIDELPDAIQQVLPVPAQKLYKDAFNSALDQHADDAQKQSGTSREETAHRLAWSQVKQKGYIKDKKTGKWIHNLQKPTRHIP